MTPKFALALPHTPWIPARAESFARLLDGLGLVEHDDDCTGDLPLEYGICARPGVPVVHLALFRDKEPNRVWSQKMWRWAVERGVRQGVTHLVQIQDDVQVAPNFWDALTAMVSAVPNQIIGLEQAHPMGPEIFRKGEHWCRTRAWLIGPAYVFPVHLLAEFLQWCDANPERVASENEDTLVNRWAAEHAQIDIWHPVPTIIDHDTSVPSTYPGNESHSHRRPTVTWQCVPAEMLAATAYWTPPQEPLPQRLVDPYANHCWYCLRENAIIASHDTGARIGKQCLARICGAMIQRL